MERPNPDRIPTWKKGPNKLKIISWSSSSKNDPKIQGVRLNISFGSKYMIIRQTHLNHQFLLSHLGFPQLDNGWFMLVLYPDECIRSDCWHLQSYSLVHYTKEILEQPSFKSNSSPISRSSKTLQLLVVHFLRIGHKTERNSCRMFLSNPQHQFQVHIQNPLFLLNGF